MSLDKAKHGLAIAIGLGDPSKMASAGAEGSAEEEGSEGYHAAADEILDAIAEKDAGALSEALKAFWGMCDASSKKPSASESTEE